MSVHSRHEITGGDPVPAGFSRIGESEGAWRMVYGRGPEGIVVSLAERIG
jgi:hypothetical protein